MNKKAFLLAEETLKIFSSKQPEQKVPAPEAKAKERQSAKVPTQKKRVPSSSTAVFGREIENINVPSWADPQIPSTKGRGVLPPSISEFRKDFGKLESKVINALPKSVQDVLKNIANTTEVSDSEKSELITAAETRNKAKAERGDYHLIPTSWLKRHKDEYPDIPERLLK